MKTFEVNIENIISEYGLRMSPKYYDVMKSFSETNSYIELSDSDSFLIESGSYIKNYISSEEGIPYLRVNNEKNYIIDESDMVYVTKKTKEKTKVIKGDIVFGRTQANLDKLGVFSMIDGEMDGSSISQHVSKIRVKNDKISPYYLLAYLNSKFGKSQMSYATYGDTRVELTHTQVKKIKVVNLDKKYVEIITNNSIQIMKKNRDALNCLKKAQNYIIDKIKYHPSVQDAGYNVSFNDLVENDIWNVTNYKPEYTAISHFIEEKTNYMSLDDLTVESIKSGCEVGSQNYLIEFEKSDDDSSFIRTSDIINNTVDIYPDYFVSDNNIPKNKLPKLDKNTILFSKDAKIGEATILSGSEKIVPGSGFSIIKINQNKALPQYVFAVLSLDISKDQALQKTVIASTIPHLKIDKLSKIKIPILDIEDQKIVAVLVDEFVKLNEEKNDLMLMNKKILDSEYNRLFEKKIA